MSTKPTVRVLLVEDNVHDAAMLHGLLRRAPITTFECVTEQWLRASVDRLQAGIFHVVLLDLSLPDAHGLDAMIELSRCAPTTPILVVTGNDDMALAVNATKLGAVDYVMKDDLSPTSLERSIIVGMERKRATLVDARLSAYVDTHIEGADALRDQTASVARAILEIDQRLRAHPEAHAQFVSALDAHGLLAILQRIQVRRSIVAPAAEARIDTLSSIVTGYAKDSSPSLPSVADSNETFMRSIRALSGDIFTGNVPP